MFRFEELQTRTDVTQALGCASTLEAIERHGANSFYEQMLIPKRGRVGQYREVYKVTDRALAAAQKNIAGTLSRDVQFPNCVQGFVRGRSTVTNAALHLAQPLILHVDIASFFESVHLDKVRVAFKRLGSGADAAEAATRLCTLDDHLVQGSSASPALANIVCRELDADLVQLAQRFGSTYSRYADDMVFSGVSVPDANDVAEVVARHGFSVNWAKVRRQRRGRAQYVTGLSVFDAQRPRAPRRLKARIRSILHFCEVHGLDDHLSRTGTPHSGRVVAQIDGWIAYLYSIESDLARRLDARWHKILAESSFTSRRRWRSTDG